jgi:hypothetical protein
MVQIRSLDLSNNVLSMIPPELGLLTSLNALLIHGNPQRGIRQNVIDEGTPSLLSALRNRLPSLSSTVGGGGGGGEKRGQQSHHQYPPSVPPSYPSYPTQSPRLQQQVSYPTQSPRLQQQASYPTQSPRLQQQQTSYPTQSPRLQQQQQQQQQHSAQTYSSYQQQHLYQLPNPDQPQMLQQGKSGGGGGGLMMTRCRTCGSNNNLEPDIDNPGDVYCNRCWSEWSS